MANLSYTEELTSEYFKHKLDNNGKLAYIVSEHVYYQGRKRTGVRGWHDIDVLAIGNKEICIVQTKSYTGSEPKMQMLRHILGDFDNAETFVRVQTYAKGKKIRKILVVDYTSEPIKNKFRVAGVEVFRLTEITDMLLQMLKNKLFKTSRLGKEESNVTRTLLFLLDHEKLKV